MDGNRDQSRDVTYRDAEEIARLREALDRALLAVTVSGLTSEGYKNACAQARELLRAALAPRPPEERPTVGDRRL